MDFKEWWKEHVHGGVVAALAVAAVVWIAWYASVNDVAWETPAARDKVRDLWLGPAIATVACVMAAGARGPWLHVTRLFSGGGLAFLLAALAFNPDAEPGAETGRQFAVFLMGLLFVIATLTAEYRSFKINSPVAPDQV